MIIGGLAGVLGALLGWFAVPCVSDLVLRRAVKRADLWWSDSVAAYQDFKRNHPGAEPQSSARGEEGAIGIWRDDAFAAAIAGNLTSKQLHTLSHVGFKVGNLEGSMGEEARQARCSFKALWWQRVLCAVVTGALFLILAMQVESYLAQVSLGVCVLAMTTAVICDLRARIIPLESCACLAIAGAIFQVVEQGLPGVLAGVVVALLIGGSCVVANRLLRVRCPGGAIGWGDVRCMSSLALVTGAGTLCGFAACYTVAACVAIAGCALGRLSWSSGMPMAPFLAAWLVCGVSVCLVVL